MAHYFFDVSSPAPAIDAEGLDLPSLEAARLEAVRLAGQLLLDTPEVIVETPGLSVTVRDGSGALFRLHVRVGALD
jgi:hypothetical protein